MTHLSFINKDGNKSIYTQLSQLLKLGSDLFTDYTLQVVNNLKGWKVLLIYSLDRRGNILPSFDCEYYSHSDGVSFTGRQEQLQGGVKSIAFAQ